MCNDQLHVYKGTITEQMLAAVRAAMASDVFASNYFEQLNPEREGNYKISIPGINNSYYSMPVRDTS